MWLRKKTKHHVFGQNYFGFSNWIVLPSNMTIEQFYQIKEKTKVEKPAVFDGTKWVSIERER